MVSRRVVLGTAGIAAAAAVPLGALATASAATTRTAPSRPAAPARLAIPHTMARRSDAVRAGVRVATSTFPLSHLAVAWHGARPPAVRVRTGSGWGDWRDAHACHGGRDDRTADRQWALVAARGAVGYEVAAAVSGGELSVVELNTVDGPVRTTGAPAAPMMRVDGRPAPVRYLSRAAWGADEKLRLNPDGTESWPAQYFPVQTLTVHHTAGANDDPDPAATVRAIYYYDAITQGWGDLGYHLLIDEAGTVYEGRWSGTDPLPVFGSTPGPDGRPQMANGAHAVGYNAGNVGVVLLGDFTDRLPTAAARRSLDAVLAVLAGVQRLDPRGTTAYVNPVSGATKTVDTISGHRDWGATECPGNLFYPQLPAVRSEVATLLHR